MERTSFSVADNSQPHGGGGRGKGGGSRGGRWTKPVICYNCDEVGHIARYCPLPRWHSCNHYWTTSHATEDGPDLIEKWEAHTIKIAANIVNSEPRMSGESYGPTINAMTKGGTKTGADASNQPPPCLAI